VPAKLAFLQKIIVGLLTNLVGIVARLLTEYIQKRGRISEAKKEIRAQRDAVKSIVAELQELDRLHAEAFKVSAADRIIELNALIMAKEQELRDASSRVDIDPRP
jgi:uncharacterized protein involved in exopolysaccharide biosynthesis